jgi:hypothetical protein
MNRTLPPQRESSGTSLASSIGCVVKSGAPRWIVFRRARIRSVATSQHPRFAGRMAMQQRAAGKATYSYSIKQPKGVAFVAE